MSIFFRIEGLKIVLKAVETRKLGEKTAFEDN